MTEHETTRLVAWSHELRAVHARLREALHLARESATAGEPLRPPARELLLFCRGFCSALSGHHRGEDTALFPAIAAARPELGAMLGSLEQDHALIAHLLDELSRAADGAAPPDELARHLDGLAAIMENHFRYEERALVTVLDALDLDLTVPDALGPL